MFSNQTTMVSLRRIITIFPRRDLVSSTHLYPLHHCHSRALHPQPPSASAPRPQHPSPCVLHQRHIRWNSTDSPAATAREPLPSRIVPRYIHHGDWLCSKCGAHNFKSRVSCFECATLVSESRVFYEEGSWSCPVCLLHVPSKIPCPPVCVCIRNVACMDRLVCFWTWLGDVALGCCTWMRLNSDGVYWIRVDGRSFEYL